MLRIVTQITLALAAALLAAACSKGGDDRPAREAVLPLLQTDGEKVDPSLGIKATWNIEGVDVKEQPGNETNPWAGTIRFRIETTVNDVDGTPLTQNLDRQFDYVYSAALKRWIIQYRPPGKS